VVVHFVDIDRIVDHHCLNFLFKMTIWNVIIIPHIKDDRLLPPLKLVAMI